MLRDRQRSNIRNWIRKILLDRCRKADEIDWAPGAGYQVDLSGVRRGSFRRRSRCSASAQALEREAIVQLDGTIPPPGSRLRVAHGHTVRRSRSWKRNSLSEIQTTKGLIMENELATMRTSLRSILETPNRWKIALWLLTVLFAGAVIMTLELAAIRLYAPYFGFSIHVWGGTIGILMTAARLQATPSADGWQTEARATHLFSSHCFSAVFTSCSYFLPFQFS